MAKAINGKVYNQAGEVIGTVVNDIETHPNVVVADGKEVVAYVRQEGGVLKSINTRTIEKLLVYGAGIVAATNGFAQLSMPNSVRAALLGVAGIITLGLHVSGNAGVGPTSNPPIT